MVPTPPGNDERTKTIPPELLKQAEQRIHFEDFKIGAESAKTGAVAIALFGGIGGIALPWLLSYDLSLLNQVKLLGAAEVLYLLYCLGKAVGTKRDEALETIVREPYNRLGLSDSTYKEVSALWNKRWEQANGTFKERSSFPWGLLAFVLTASLIAFSTTSEPGS